MRNSDPAVLYVWPKCSRCGAALEASRHTHTEVDGAWCSFLCFSEDRREQKQVAHA